jgi:hypothetical protein
MRKFLLILLGLLLLIALGLWWYVSSFQKQQIVLPKAKADTVVVNVTSSFFRLPIRYSLQGLQDFLNGKFQGEFLATTISPTGNEKDQVRLQMSKTRGIRISARGQNLVIQFPLQVKATIMNSRLRFITKGIKPVETEALITLQTPVSLDANWKLVTRFTLSEVHWVQAPVVTLAGIRVDLTKKVDELIAKEKDKLSDMLDREINKAVSLQQPVGKIWEDLQKPMVIVKKPTEVYLRFVCEDIGGDFKLTDKDLVCYTTIKTKVAIVPKKNTAIPVLQLPAFRKVAKISSLSEASVYGFVGFDMINREVRHALQGKRFAAKQMSASVEQVSVYATDSGIAVHAMVKGDIGGELAATGTPVFDSVQQQFKLENFQFQIASDNSLLNAGESLLHSRIRDSLQRHLMIGLDAQITQIPQLIEQAIAKGRTGKTIDVKLDKFTIHSCRVLIGALRIQLNVRTSFEGAITLKKLNAGKAIRIKPKKKPSS